MIAKISGTLLAATNFVVSKTRVYPKMAFSPDFCVIMKGACERLVRQYYIFLFPVNSIESPHCWRGTNLKVLSRKQLHTLKRIKNASVYATEAERK